MPDYEKIRVMISSRCTDKFPMGSNESLSEFRVAAKKELDSIKLLGKQVFEVWINEAAPPKGGNWDSLEVCLNAVSECDILIVLNNKNSGWAGEGSIGICHQEVMHAFNTCPGKIRGISLASANPTEDRHIRYAEYLERCNFFRGGTVETAAELKLRLKEAILDALLTLAHGGVREAMKGKFHTGEALDWTRLNFLKRQESMVSALKQAILKRSGTKEQEGRILVKIASHETLFVLHGIPASLGIPSAKEMVGQPFLKDHTEFLPPHGTAGPFHLIACHKGATEAQATRLLGTADATVVNAPFGIYVSDYIYQTQFAFLANCRDDTTTRHAVARFFDWLKSSGEGVVMEKRAIARARIVRAIASVTAVDENSET